MTNHFGSAIKRSAAIVGHLRKEALQSFVSLGAYFVSLVLGH